MYLFCKVTGGIFNRNIVKTRFFESGFSVVLHASGHNIGNKDSSDRRSTW